MTIEVVREFLAWCTLINIGLLVWWFLWLFLAHDWIYKLHGRWFKLSEERFDAIHYAAIAFFKLSVFVFNLVPYLALRIIG
jgi:hypothetical protein